MGFRPLNHALRYLGIWCALTCGCSSYRVVRHDGGGEDAAVDHASAEVAPETPADRTGTPADSGGEAAEAGILLVDGRPCATGSECTSTFCVDGVCCESTCTGLCLACSIQKTNAASGLCRAIVVGTDPDDECAQDVGNPCGHDGTCGAGVCRLQPQGTPCGDPSCLDGTFTPGGTCNGSGTCVPVATARCPGNFACSLGIACRTGCTDRSTTGCAAGFECVSGSCVQATVGCRAVTCPVGTGGQCCWMPPDFPGTATCLSPGQTCPVGSSSVFCDGGADCPSDQICCVTATGDAVGQWSTSCMPAAACHDQFGGTILGRQVCDPALIPTLECGLSPCIESFFNPNYSTCG